MGDIQEGDYFRLRGQQGWLRAEGVAVKHDDQPFTYVIMARTPETPATQTTIFSPSGEIEARSKDNPPSAWTPAAIRRQKENYKKTLEKCDEALRNLNDL